MIPIPSQIKNKIKFLRQQKGIDQYDLAKALGITRPYLSKIETYKFSAGTDLMIKVCEYFNKELGEIFYIDKNTSKSEKN